MSNTPLTSQNKDKRKALLMAKIYAERELISLQAQRIIYDVQPSTIKNNLIESAVEKLQMSKTSRSLFNYIDRHPTVSWTVAQLLVQSVKRTRSSWWRPLAIGAASWFISSKNRARRRAAARDMPLTGPRIRAQSRPIRYEEEDLYLDVDEQYASSPRPLRASERQRPKRRVFRRRS
ncbi:MAG: hypothetical protein Q4G44_06450 [Alcaligenaceae bacterium]|nr:hypothetical protein [Alcaligenaceae bacterium]